MKVEVEEISPIERKLTIEVAPEKVNDAFDRAYQQLGRKVKLPGFRPGHIPRRILEQRFQAHVKEDVVRTVVEQAYREAIAEKKVEAVGRAEIDNGEIHPSAPFTFRAKVEVKPKLEPQSYEGLSLEKLPREVTDEQVNERIEQLRQRMGRLEPVEGRDAAAAEDWATVDFEGTIEGQPFEGGKRENATVQVTKGELLEGNFGFLEGAKVGETKEVDYVFPESHPVEAQRGKTAHFTVRLQGLKVSVMPELDDELAKELGVGQTLDDLKAQVRTDLEKAKGREVERTEREAVLNKLIEANPFDAPKAMIEGAIDQMTMGALRVLAQSGMDPSALDSQWPALREEMRESATREVKGALLLEAIADKEQLKVEDAEIDQHLEELAKDSGRPLFEVKRSFRTSEAREGLRARLREKKTVEFLEARANHPS